MRFLSAIVRGVAYATMDSIARDPGNAEQYREAGFNALWAMLRAS